MFGALINGSSTAAKLIYIGKILFGGDRILPGQINKEKNGNSHSVEYDLNHGGGYLFGTRA
jgi:hypothetical protein